MQWGLLGVVAFSFTVPFTKIAVAGLTPLFVGSARAVVAALLAAAALALTGQRLPRGSQWPRLAAVAAGVVAGFPLLTSYALTAAPAGHAAVVIALLPAATAVAAALRGRERPPLLFWILSASGACVTVAFAAVGSGGLGVPHWIDLLLVGAVVAAAAGYAEGGLLARELGAWQTISWALVLATPAMTALTVVSMLSQTPAGTPSQWAAFAYLAAVSMFLGFVAWYRGLEIGPMAQVSQIQLVQPVLGLCWAALLLGEHISVTTAVGGVLVVGCASLTVRLRLHHDTRGRVAHPRTSDAGLSGCSHE